MNKINIAKISIILCAAVIISGCQSRFNEEDYYSLEVPKKKLREINTIELSQTPAQTSENPAATKEVPVNLEISIEQCRATVLENNLNIKATLISPTIAAKQVNEAEAKFESSFSSSVNLAKSDQPQASPLSLEGSQVEQASTNFGVEIPMKTGGKISFNLGDRRTKTDYSSSTFNPSYTSNLSIPISQPL